MKKSEFIDRHCHFPEYNREEFESDLDELLKQHAIEAMKAFVPNLEAEDYENCYNEWIKPE